MVERIVHPVEAEQMPHLVVAVTPVHGGVCHVFRCRFSALIAVALIAVALLLF
jgi:hypothetical protein